jgi:hypothetical protein
MARRYRQSPADLANKRLPIAKEAGLTSQRLCSGPHRKVLRLSDRGESAGRIASELDDGTTTSRVAAIAIVTSGTLHTASAAVVDVRVIPIAGVLLLAWIRLLPRGSASACLLTGIAACSDVPAAAVLVLVPTIPITLTRIVRLFWILFARLVGSTAGDDTSRASHTAAGDDTAGTAGTTRAAVDDDTTGATPAVNADDTAGTTRVTGKANTAGSTRATGGQAAVTIARAQQRVGAGPRATANVRGVGIAVVRTCHTG